MLSSRRAPEPVHVVSTEEDRVRLGLGGARYEVAGGYVRAVPDVTRAVLANLRFGQLPAVTGHDSLLVGFLQPGSKEWNEYFSTRKVVERPHLTKRGGKVSVAANFWDVTTVEQATAQPLVSNGETPRQRKYELVQILTDPYLQDKFQLTEEVRSTLRVMAVGQPDAAAARAQTLLRSHPGLENCIVSAGRYSRSKSWARASVRSHASRFPYLTASCDASVTGTKLIMYGPGVGRNRWFVSGPVWCGGEVADVYRMVCTAGTAPTMFALGSELTILDIDISDGFKFESPTVEYHAGSQADLPGESATDSTALLSAQGRIEVESFVHSLETVEIDSEVVATAVRITPKFVLVNDHVVNSGGFMTVAGREAQPVRIVGKDLWLVRSVAAVQSAWTYREPVQGEAVMVVYRKGDKVQYTSPMTVRTCDGVSIVMSKSTTLVPGMSGGALIALRDLAFLGVYEGIGSQLAMAGAFTQEHFTDVCTAEHMSSVGHSEAEDAEGSLYAKMKGRGLGRMLDSVIASLEPLFAGHEHVGMGYVSGSVLRTPCDPGASPLAVGLVRKKSVFEASDRGTFVTQVAEVRAGPMLMRRPSYSEKVFVIGRDDEGPYYSSVSSRVIHIGVSARTFVIDAVDIAGALPLSGGLVVAVTDGAVLGQYVRHHTTPLLGEGGFCVSLFDLSPSAAALVEPVEAVLSRLFPMLHIGTWPKEVLEEVFTHSSAQGYDDGREFNHGNLPLAYIGDGAMRVAFGVKMRDSAVEYSKWQRVAQRLQSNVALASLVEDFGLDKYVITGRGVSLPKGAKAKADVMEALAAAVYLNETSEAFLEFCEVCGLVADEAPT